MIRFEAVTKSYDERKVIDKLSLNIVEGSNTALMGPSGCGKTTIFRLATGLERPDSGKIVIRDKTRFAAVFQDDRLCLSLSLYANVKAVCGKSVKKRDIYACIAMLGLGGFENKPASVLSGGMKKRACIIRAMLSEFDMLFLDEPFNGLDAQTKEIVAKFITERLDGRTLVLITHDMRDVELLGCETIMLEKNTL